MEQSQHSLAGIVDFAEHFATPLAEAARTAIGRYGLLLPADVIDGVVDEIVERVRTLFGRPLPEILAGAWEKSAEIQEFCDPAKHPPGEASVVELAEHTVAWSDEPVVEVVFNPLATVQIRILLKAEATLAAGALVIQDATFKKLRTGKVDVAASLAVQGVELLRRKVPYELPGELSLGIPIRPLIAVGKIAADAQPAAVA